MSHHDTLTQALRGLLGRYTTMVSSGDAGDWNPETEPEVIAARAALSTLPDKDKQSDPAAFMNHHFRHLAEGRKEYTEAEVRMIMAAMQDEIDTQAAQIASLQAQQSDGRGTDAQIEKERDIARHAIVGSLAAGYAGHDHPGADHWLAAAHEAGARVKELEAQAQQSEPIDSMGMPLSCGKPLCAPGDHHTLCKFNEQAQQVAGELVAPAEREELAELIRSTWARGNASWMDIAQAVLDRQARAIDPLQGAADWLKSAIDDLQTSDLAGRLSIGHNRAWRLLSATHTTPAQAAQQGGKE